MIAREIQNVANLQVVGTPSVTGRSQTGINQDTNVDYGLDDTEVVEAGAAYVLKKTMTFWGLDASHPLDRSIIRFWGSSGGANIYVKVTVESDTVAETVEDEEIESDAAIHLISKLWSQLYYGTYVTVRLYLKTANAGNVAHCDIFDIIGILTTWVAYD